jgi:hypothetical protein
VKHAQGARLDRQMIRLQFRFSIVEKMGCQGRDIRDPTAQRRKIDCHCVYAKKQILPESARVNIGLKSPVGGGHKAKIGLNLLVSSNPRERFLFEDPQ